MKKKPYVLEYKAGGARWGLSKVGKNWYWTLSRRRGGKIVADGSEGYHSKSNVLRAIKALPMDWSKVEVKDSV